MKNRILILFILIICNYSSNAQCKSYNDLDEKMAKALLSQFQNSSCPDSAGLYNFAIKIDLSFKQSKVSAIKFSVDDSLFYKIFKDINILKTIDYTTVAFGRNHIQLILPLAVVVVNKKNDTTRQKVYVEDIANEIYKLFYFNKDTEDKTYLRPVFIQGLRTLGY